MSWDILAMIKRCWTGWITVNYREAYNLYACNGILFNKGFDRKTSKQIIAQNKIHSCHAHKPLWPK